MIIKYCGSVLVFLGAVFLGFGRGTILRRREKYLMNLCSFLDLLEVEIQFSAQRLGRMFLRLDEHIQLGNLLKSTSENLENGVAVAWSDAVKNHTPSLLAEDREILVLLGAKLGMTDRDTQIKNIRHVKHLIQKQYEDAKQERNRLSKLYEGGGVLVGLFLVILLF